MWMGFWTKLKGKATRPIADAAGDRRSEARNAVEAETGEKPPEPVIDVVEQAARRQHGDVEG
jgi:hypothetical protein